jgi:hypothetical protein
MLFINIFKGDLASIFEAVLKIRICILNFRIYVQVPNSLKINRKLISLALKIDIFVFFISVLALFLNVYFFVLVL